MWHIGCSKAKTPTTRSRWDRTCGGLTWAIHLAHGRSKGKHWLFKDFLEIFLENPMIWMVFLVVFYVSHLIVKNFPDFFGESPTNVFDFPVIFQKNAKGFSRNFPRHVHHFYAIFQNFMGSLRCSRMTMGFSWELPFSQASEEVWSFRPRKPLPWVPLSPISWVPTIFKILTIKKQMR